MTWNPDPSLVWVQITQIYSNRLTFLMSPCPDSSCHSGYFPVFSEEFFEVEKGLYRKRPVRSSRGNEDGELKRVRYTLPKL